MKEISITILFSMQLINGEELALKKIATAPEKSIYITQPLSENNRLFVLNQRGLIYIIKNGGILKKPFLNINDRVHSTLNPKSRSGMLGMAFHPNYKKNGFFFIHYINKNDKSIVSRFSVTNNKDIADKNTEKIIIKIPQPDKINVGGHLAFGPKDGFLYIAIGSPNQNNEEKNNAQDLTNLYGSIIRINVDQGEPYSIPKDNPFVNEYYKRPEIFCFGLKNPWRFSFDSKNNDIIIGDINEKAWQEINWNSWDESIGANFGWNIMEGKHCYDEESFCDTTNLKQPIYEYPNNASYMRKFINMGHQETSGCAITGGYVYRGVKHHSLQGVYIFGDYCNGRIWAFKKNNNIFNLYNLQKKLKDKSKSLPISIASFGEDNSGELYIVDYMGPIYKFISN